MATGAAWRFDDDNDSANLTAANVNSLDVGGNVYHRAAGGLFVNVSALIYWLMTSGKPVRTTYAGVADQAVTQSDTNYVYINAAGSLVVNTTGFPTDTTGHIPLAEVVASATTVTSITDRRPKICLFPLDVPRLPSYTVAELGALTGSAAGDSAYANDGRKAGEGGGSGTGVLAFYDGSNWIACDTGATLAA